MSSDVINCRVSVCLIDKWCKNTFDKGLVLWSQHSPIDEGDHKWESSRCGVEQTEPETTIVAILLFWRRKELLEFIIIGIGMVVVLRVV